MRSMVNSKAPPQVGQKEQKKANPFGLYDMLTGNNIVSDIYHPDFYRISPKKDPKGPDKGKLRITRGGGVNISDVRLNPILAATHRLTFNPPRAGDGRGGRFRLVLEFIEDDE